MWIRALDPIDGGGHLRASDRGRSRARPRIVALLAAPIGRIFSRDRRRRSVVPIIGFTAPFPLRHRRTTMDEETSAQPGRPPSEPASARSIDRLAVYHAPDAYSVSMPKLMGRNVAGDGFLRALVRHAGLAAIDAVVDDPRRAGDLAGRLAGLGWQGRSEVIDRAVTGRLAAIGTLFHPGSDIEMHARRRSLFGPAAWSLCGVTHTTPPRTG
jgi:hypothetical protein